MKNLTKIILFGLLTWLIPFLVSFFFVDMRGNYLIEETFFKTIMIVTGGLTGVILMIVYFSKIENNYLKEALIIGCSWLVINWILDLIMVLNGFFSMTIQKYFMDIGLRYLLIPIISIGMGYMLEKKK